MSANRVLLLALVLASVETNWAWAQQLPKSTEPAATQILEEVMVTAQKRSESLMDVPAAISAIRGERLESLQVGSLSDLANYVPGLSVAAGGAPGYRTIVIRGVSGGYYETGGPLTGTYIDDLPIGATQGGRPALFGLDVNPYDIERVEVLKGPQGTLYGANTMGGLVKYSLRRPDTSDFEARIGADLLGVDGAGNTGWSARGSLSVPVVRDVLAMRLSAFHKENPGYIENTRLGTRDVNSSTQSGGILSVFWQLTDRFVVRAAVLAQESEADNMAAVSFDGYTMQPLSGPFTTDSRFAESFEQSTRTYSLSVDWDLGSATLTSATGWSELSSIDTEDFTVPFGSYCIPGSLTPTWLGCPDYPQAALAQFNFVPDVSKFVEEIRLASSGENKFQWMIGGYYTKEDVWSRLYVPALTPTYEYADLILDSIGEGEYRETALFANVTYGLTDQLDVSVGGRYSEYENSSCGLRDMGALAAGRGNLNNTVRCLSLPKTDVSLWMANVRYHLNEEAMLYARAANSYRPGSGCRFYSDGTPCGNPVLGFPGIIEADKTTNYEAGFKGSFIEGRMQLDLSLFHVEWDNIQLTQRSPTGIIYPGNGGTATSTGLELTAGFRPTYALQVDATIGYTDAHLTEDAPGAGGRSGDQLPSSALWSGSLTLDYSRPLSDSNTLLLGGGYRYRGSVKNQFPNASGPPGDRAATIGPQRVVNAHAGVAMRNLTIRLYGTNLFNDESYTGLLYLTDIDRPRFVPVQPRTIGLSIDYKFGRAAYQ